MAPPTVAATLAWARAELGRTENPRGSNRYLCHDGVDLWSWYDARLQRNPWCAAWVSRCWAATGDPIPIQTELGFHHTPTALAWFRRHRRVVPKAEARPGDLVFFQFDDDPQVDHVGFVESNAGSHLVTLEGNTSPDSRGSQSNGGGVFRRKRWASVAAVCRPPYAQEVTPMYSPPWTLPPGVSVVAGLVHPQGLGAVLLLSDGGTWDVGPPHCGNVVNKAYFRGRRPARIEVNPNWEAAGRPHVGTAELPWYIIRATSGETYGHAGFAE